MRTWLTGATGYIGGYVLAELLRRGRDEAVYVLVRARDRDHAAHRLWRSVQLHMSAEEFADLADGRVHAVLGDLTAPRFGLDDGDWRSLAHDIDSFVHIAASLNRKSAKACFNVNLRGTLTMAQLAREAHEAGGVRRFVDVSTTAAAGKRRNEVVAEDDMISWDRSDYDPYARTKKFCEHMIEELLPDISTVVVRPSTVLGDSRFPETTQFDMVRAFVFLARLPYVPMDPSWRMDIVPADFVSDGICWVHHAETLDHASYNLSASRGSVRYAEITEALEPVLGRRARYIPALAEPFSFVVDVAASERSPATISKAAALLKVFMPYIQYNTVFENQRIVAALGREPAPFPSYAAGLMRFAESTRFTYPYRDWPATQPLPRVAL